MFANDGIDLVNEQQTLCRGLALFRILLCFSKDQLKFSPEDTAIRIDFLDSERCGFLDVAARREFEWAEHADLDRRGLRPGRLP